MEQSELGDLRANKISHLCPAKESRPWCEEPVGSSKLLKPGEKQSTIPIDLDLGGAAVYVSPFSQRLTQALALTLTRPTETQFGDFSCKFNPYTFFSTLHRHERTRGWHFLWNYFRSLTSNRSLLWLTLPLHASELVRDHTSFVAPIN